MRITAAQIERTYRPTARAMAQAPPGRRAPWLADLLAAEQADEDLAHEARHWRRHRGAKHRTAKHRAARRRSTRLRNQPKGTTVHPRRPGLDLAHLRAFVHVADTGSITRAAPALGYSQPGLSQRLQTLERALGARLLARGPDGVRPTPAGETALTHARTILNTADQLRQEMTRHRTEPDDDRTETDDRTEADRTEPDRTEPDRTEPDDRDDPGS
jgi:molybdenum-dependent DNA-binding transcriptional regulator ModE